MNANGYDVTVNPDGVIVVDTYEAIAARQATIPLQNRTVRLNYSRALGVKAMVRGAAHARLRSRRLQSPRRPRKPRPPAAAAESAHQSLTCPTRGTVTADTITN